MPVEQVARSGKARCKLRALLGVPAPEAADAVAKAVVPFGKSRRMVTELIAARANVPRLGNQLYALEDRVLSQCVEEARARIEAVGLTAERDAEIEPKAVDMILRHPIA